MDANAAIAAAIVAVRARIAAACARVGRDPADVLLLGASKTVPAAAVEAAARAGLTAVGENRVQEFLRKRPEVRAPLRWDLIGTLQTNKVRAITGEATLIHGVDTIDLARAIGAAAVSRGVTQAILLEVNTSGEISKHGVPPNDVRTATASIDEIDGVTLQGLMTMAAPGDPVASRASFARLRALSDHLPRRLTGDTLSMGMSDDLEIAVEEGATIVRVGSAIFGARPHRDG